MLRPVAELGVVWWAPVCAAVSWSGPDHPNPGTRLLSQARGSGATLEQEPSAVLRPGGTSRLEQTTHWSQCPAQDERERKWRVQAVSVSPGSFQNRLSLPAAWRGLRDPELSAVAGIPGLVFVHASGFIGGADTQEAAVEMARRALAAE